MRGSERVAVDSMFLEDLLVSRLADDLWLNDVGAGTSEERILSGLGGDLSNIFIIHVEAVVLY